MKIFINSVKLHQDGKLRLCNFFKTDGKLRGEFMEKNMREVRKKIFNQVLFMLETEGYLSEAVVEEVAKAHHQYHLDLKYKESCGPLLPVEKKVNNLNSVVTKPKKVKKTLTMEEVRERNITWSLNIGVIFLLIGGLFVATSNWESLTSMMKSGFIAIVALLFYVLALITKKVLHIEKTAFAFNVLGSLFLPIFILSLGWYGLLGPYLSISGKGHFILGIIGSFLSATVYVHLSKHLASRLFVWFTFTAVSAGVAFFLASFYLKIDFFYLGLMIFNILFIFIYHRVKNNDSLKLFTHEFVPFIQVNIVLSTLFMIFLYDNQVLYSFNLLLTAIIYLSMIYVTGRKEYHFVFSIMIVYGAYQLIEHSALTSIGAIVYAIMGFGIAFVPKWMKQDFSLDKAFHYTSAVISGCAFIYISLEGIFLHFGTPSIVLMIAYLIMAINFLYLAYSDPKRLFSYLSSAFIASAIYEGTALIGKPFEVIHFSFTLFITGFTLYIVVGIVTQTKYLKIIRTSSRDIGAAIMTVAIITAFGLLYWWELGTMLMLVAVISYFMNIKEERRNLQESAKWILPISLGLGIVAFGEEVNANFPTYDEQYGNTINFVAGALLVFLSRIGWKQFKKNELERTSFYISQILYSIGIALALVNPIYQLWLQPFVLLFGIGMYTLLYRTHGSKWFAYLISFTTLLAYFSIIHAILDKYPFIHTIDSFIPSSSAVLLLFIGYLFRIKDTNLLSSFAWLGNGIYPFALLYTLFAFHTDSFFSFLLAVFVYGFSALQEAKEWKLKLFLYGSFTSLLFVFTTGIDYLDAQDFSRYEFPITSASILLFWIFANQKIKERTAYYLVPFSLFGIVITLITYPFGWSPYLIAIIYSMALLVYLHLLKWDLLAIVPLFFTFFATVEFFVYSGMDSFEKMLWSGGLGILSTLIGQIVYNKLVVSSKKLQEVKVDAYTVISYLFYLLMYYFDNQQVWTLALPGLLIAATVWLQRNRVPAKFSVFVVILSGVYLLQPYYSVIGKLNVPAIWEREVLVLPWIALVVFIRLKFKGMYTKVTKPLEWGVLLVVSMLLIQDGLVSSNIYDAIILGTLALISNVVRNVLANKIIFLYWVWGTFA
ncbi:hypothetical protein BN000_03705 [Neobacillus massiliamazoniensis]|uniref:DUF2157 domain-containing protein n=2 Tax=Neobacillus massiliamazoniensis TaxID=1499688 RepID=A0A0U1P0B7_9BACI|nr:hypothetical protein BN000_03705 [Neobacillus massiliamazoniensis]